MYMMQLSTNVCLMYVYVCAVLFCTHNALDKVPTSFIPVLSVSVYVSSFYPLLCDCTVTLLHANAYKQMVGSAEEEVQTLLPRVKETEQFMQLFGRDYLSFDVSLQRAQVRCGAASSVVLV